MQTKQIHTRNGASFEISGKKTPQKYNDCRIRMEFNVNGPEQHVIHLNLSNEASFFLERELNKFEPHEWLWENGCDIIKNGAECDKLLNGDFMILEHHVHRREPIEFETLEMDFHPILLKIKKFRSVLITRTKHPKPEPISVKKSYLQIDGYELYMPEVKEILKLTKDNMIDIMNGVHVDIEYGGIKVKYEFSLNF